MVLALVCILGDEVNPDPVTARRFSAKIKQHQTCFMEINVHIIHVYVSIFKPERSTHKNYLLVETLEH